MSGADGHELRLDPQTGYNAGCELMDGGTALKALHSGPGLAIEAASAPVPWGTDNVGQKFEPNYRKFERQFMDALDAVGLGVEVLGAAVARSVENLVKADDTAAQLHTRLLATDPAIVQARNHTS